MTVKMKMATAGAIAGFAIAGVLGTGVANASVTNSVPTANYQLCGNVTDAASGWSSSGPSPSAAVGVPGLTVSGQLYNSGGTPVSAVFTSPAVTDVNGAYCVQGGSSMVSIVLAGGYAKLWTDGANTPQNTWETTGIYESDFLAHIFTKTSGLPSTWITQSANNFHMVR